MNYIRFSSLLVGVLCIFGIYSCEEDSFLESSPNFNVEDNSSFNFVVHKSYQLNLDNLTGPQIVSPQYIREGSTEKEGLLTFLNVINNTIYIYNYRSDSLVSVRSFDKEGPNAIKEIKGYQFINLDSLFILDYKNLFLFNRDNELIKKISINRQEVGDPTFSPTQVPLTISDGEINISNDALGFFDLKCRYIIQSNSESYYKYPIPSSFIDGFTGLGVFAYWNFAYNEQRRQFIYNFANLEHLYLLNHNFDTIDSILVESKYFSGAPDKLHNSKVYRQLEKGIEVNAEKYETRAKARHYYSLILYDEFRNLYYRIIGFPIPQDDIQSNDPQRRFTRQFSIMVLDEEFNTLGEYLLPRFDYLIPQSLFITEEGLNMQKSIENEDLMQFDVFKLQRK